jgi:hypothetical protein
MPANCDRARLATQPELARPAAAWVASTPSTRTSRPPAPAAWRARAATWGPDGGIATLLEALAQPHMG